MAGRPFGVFYSSTNSKVYSLAFKTHLVFLRSSLAVIEALRTPFSLGPILSHSLSLLHIHTYKMHISNLLTIALLAMSSSSIVMATPVSCDDVCTTQCSVSVLSSGVMDG